MATKEKTDKKVKAPRASKKEPTTMDELLARTGYEIKSFSRGEKVPASFVELDRNSAIFDVGGKSEGIINDVYFQEAKELIKTLKKGDTVTATVIDPETSSGFVLLSLRQAAQEMFWNKLKNAQKEGKPVEVTGKLAAERGLMVDLDNFAAFIPTTQLNAKNASNPDDLVGKRFMVKIIDVDPDRNKVVLSEKAISEEESIKKMKKAFAKVKNGEIYDGVVTTLTSFGAFVEIKVAGTKVEGLVHVSELSWGKVDDPSELFEVGDEVKVKVIDVKNNKLALSIKQAEKDPWTDAAKHYKVDDKVKGKVVRISDFGAFVELTPGIEGLIHMTKIPPSTKLEMGADVNCYIEDINIPERRISLGLVITSSKPVGYK